MQVWCLGGRQDTVGLGPGFFSLASCCIILYDPHQDPLAALSYWQSVCCGSGQAAPPPLVALACCPAVGSSGTVRQAGLMGGDSLAWHLAFEYGWATALLTATARLDEPLAPIWRAGSSGGR